MLVPIPTLAMKGTGIKFTAVKVITVDSNNAMMIVFFAIITNNHSDKSRGSANHCKIQS